MQDRTRKAALTKVGRGNQTPPSSLIGRSGRMIVEYLGDFGPKSQRLDMVVVGQVVTATATVTAVNVRGTGNRPRAIVTVCSTDGESAQCTVNPDRYPHLFGFLVEGTRVQLRGEVRRPLRDMPALIDVMSIRRPVEAVTA